jgi:hypothetical protein
VIKAIHHGELSTLQRQALIALLLHLAACSSAAIWCPEMSAVQTAYRELLAAADRAQAASCGGISSEHAR